MSEELKPGDKVLYVPSLDFWHDGGGAHFNFVHVADGPPVAVHGRKRGGPGKQARAGEAVEGSFHLGDGDSPLGKVEAVKDGVIHTGKGFKLKVAGHKEEWPGVVSEEVTRTPRKVNATIEGVEQDAIVFDESRTLVIDVQQPGSCMTHHFPLDVLPHDPTGQTPHSYHLPEEAAK